MNSNLSRIKFSNVPEFGRTYEDFPDITLGALTESFGAVGEEDLSSERGIRTRARGFTPKSASPASLGAHIYSVSVPRRPEEVIVLESILKEEYGCPVTITAIKDRAVTRKQVKEIRFQKSTEPEWLYKAWMFKADPVETAKELVLYHVAHNNNIPTGKPIGYPLVNAQTKYPFDIALIGRAIVEHAGDPYTKLITEDLQLNPDAQVETGIQIAKQFARMHHELTKKKEQLQQYGIPLAVGNPTNEIVTRFAAGLNIAPESVQELSAACETLYKKQKAPLVVSHRDTHLGNVVTKIEKQATSLKQFGIIDWGSVGLDNPFSDVVDFGVHFARQVSMGTDVVDTFAIMYQNELKSISGIELHPNDFTIQNALWNIYEMFDPARKESNDIKSKAKYHYSSFYMQALLLRELRLGEFIGPVQEQLRKHLPPYVTM